MVGARRGIRLIRFRVINNPFVVVKRKEDQIGEEVERLIRLVQRVYGDFGLPFTAKLSTRPADFLGEVATWDRAETQLKAALVQSNPQALWQPNYELFVWVTFLGAYISVGQREHPWFVIYMARVARVRGLESAQDLKAVLRSFFYIDRVYGEGLESIWGEVSILMDAI